MMTILKKITNVSKNVLNQKWILIIRRIILIGLIIWLIYLLLISLIKQYPWSIFLILVLAVVLSGIWLLFGIFADILTTRGTIFESVPFLNFKKNFKKELKKDFWRVLLAVTLGIPFMVSSFIFVLFPVIVFLIAVSMVKKDPLKIVGFLRFFIFGLFAFLISIRILCQAKSLNQKNKENNIHLARDILFFLLTLVIISSIIIFTNFSSGIQQALNQISSSSSTIGTLTGTIFFIWLMIEYLIYKMKVYNIFDFLNKLKERVVAYKNKIIEESLK